MNKLEADRRLIRALADCEPIDWTRRHNGDLVYLNEKGQKFILADAEIQKLRSATQGRGAEMSEPRQFTSAIGSDSTDAALARKKAESMPAKKIGLRSEAEMHEPSKTSSAIGSGSAQDKKTDPSPAKNEKPEDTSAALYPEGSE
jgi:hypothetical protein